MENERPENINILYLDLKHVHKYVCAKFQPNPLFSSQQTATKSAAEETKRTKKKEQKKKLGHPANQGPGSGTCTCHRRGSPCGSKFLDAHALSRTRPASALVTPKST